MDYHISLKISLEDKRREAINEFYECIGSVERYAIDIKIYKIPERKEFLAPPSYNYIDLIGVTGSIASIGSILWMAYEKYKERKKINATLNEKSLDPKKENSFEKLTLNLEGPDIRVIIDDPKTAKQIEFVLNEDTNKDVFINTFTQKVSDLMSAEASKQDYEKDMSKISGTIIWIKRK